MKLIYIIQKQQLPRGVLSKRCSENMQQIYRRTSMPYTKNTSRWLLLIIIASDILPTTRTSLSELIFKNCSQKVRKIHKKTSPSQVLSHEFCEVFTFFYQQPFYKHLALGWQITEITKKLSELKPYSLTKLKNRQFTKIQLPQASLREF